jgi:simple sugar transport system permease protein
MTTSASARSAGIRASRDSFLRSHIGLAGVVALIVVTSAVFSLGSPYFLDAQNFINIFRQEAPALVIAVGMTFVITTKGIDLSVGSLTAVTGCLGAVVLQGTSSPVFAIALMIAAGAAAGAANGYFVAYQKLPPFIVTLAGLTAYQGVAFLITGGTSILVTDQTFSAIGGGSVAGLPIPVLMAVIVALLGWFVFAHTRFGMHVVAIGSNIVGSRRAGVPTARVLVLVYIVSGVLAAVAGLIIMGRLMAGSSNTGQTLALEVVTGVVLGGTSLFGGRGSVLGSMLGILLLGIISNGLTLLQFSPFYVPIVQGGILLVALLAQSIAGLQSREV